MATYRKDIDIKNLFKKKKNLNFFTVYLYANEMTSKTYLSPLI